MIDQSGWVQLIQPQKKYQDYEYPKISIIIPTLNNSETVATTIDSLLFQRYPDFEIIVIDGGSVDRTIEVLKNYHDERISIYTVKGYQRYVMLNRGIAQATGDYINCLFPGDFYVSSQTLSLMMDVALDSRKPDLVYCGTLLRDGKTDPKILLRPLSEKLLKNGQQPTSLQSCWFKTERLRQVGKFNINYQLRGGFDLLCKFFLAPNLSVVGVDRVLTDYDLRLITNQMIISHFIETFKIVWHYFGAYQAVCWLFHQKDIRRMLKRWYKAFKLSITGP